MFLADKPSGWVCSKTEGKQRKMSLSGRLNTMDLPEVLQWVTIGRKTGSLAFVRDKLKIHIFFKDGQIISSRSNDPTKQLGQFLLFQGKLTEAQLKRAFELHLQARMMLGKILVQEHLVSQEDVESALKTRTEEVIYDLFLWDDGYFHFSPNGYNIEELIQIKMDINAVLFEGIRRKDEWARIREVFPSNNLVLSLRSDVDLKTLSLTPMQKKLLYLLTLNKPISEIILELHGSDFLVNFELFQLYEKNIVEVKEVLQAPVEEVSPAKLFNKGLELMQNRNYQEAIAAFQEVIRLDPQNTWATEQIDQAERAMCQEYYRSSVPASKTPYFLIPESNLTHYNLTNEEGFVASRINGTWDIKSIVMLSPLRELEILQVLDKLLKMELIALK
jgi:tetratricopeptide (TPR) repeat protein